MFRSAIRRYSHIALTVALVLGISSANLQEGFAAPTTWNGGVGSYTDGTQWDTVSAPTNSDVAIINSGTASAAALSIRPDVASNGAVLNVGGTGTVNVTTNDLTIRNAGLVTQTGGSVTANRWVILGDNTAGDNYNISAGTVTASNAVILGNNTGGSQVTQTGGTVNSNVWTGIGQSPGTSTYNLSGTGIFNAPGTENDTTGAALQIGRDNGSIGIFNQDGGTVNVSNAAGDIRMGGAAGSVGTYNQTSGDVNVGRWVLAGQGGTGNYNLSGGTANVTRAFVLANGGGSTGNATQTGGTLNSNAWMGIGQGGAGTYTLTDGIINVGPGGDGRNSLTFGDGAGSSGTFIQSGGGVNVNGVIEMARAGGSTAAYNISGGSVTSANSLIVGSAGTATFVQDGGTVTVNAGEFQMGNGGAASGTYTINDGFLDLNVRTRIANVAGSTATFNQNGGLVDVLLHNTLAQNAGSIGTYNLTAGTLNSSTAGVDAVGMWVGVNGNGLFNQSGGTHTVTREMYIAGNGGSTGVYNLDGGDLNIIGGAAGSIRLGQGGTGTLNQTAGNLTTDGFMAIGQVGGTTGVYNISGGAATLNDTGTGLWVGVDGNGTVNQTGGNIVVANDLRLAGNAPSTGTYNLSDGNLSVGGNVFGTGTSTMHVDGSGATFTVAGDYTQNAISTLRSTLDNEGVSLISVSPLSNTNIAGTVDVDLSGGAAMLTTPVHGLVGGGLTLNDTSSLDAASDVLWNKSAIGTTVVTTLDGGLDQGPLAFAGSTGPFAGLNEGYVSITGINDDPMKVLLDVDITNATLSDLINFMSAGGLDAAPIGSTLGPGFDIALTFNPTANNSFFAWDFSDFDIANSSTTVVQAVGAVIPEPSTFLLAAIGLLGASCMRRRRHRIA